MSFYVLIPQLLLAFVLCLCISFCSVSFFLMASQDSTSSGSGMSVDQRIESLENRIAEIRGRVERQERLRRENKESVDSSWDLLNTDIRLLRTEHEAHRQETEAHQQDIREEATTGFKDVAVTLGEFGQRIADLEVRLDTMETPMGKLASKLEQ